MKLIYIYIYLVPSLLDVRPDRADLRHRLGAPHGRGQVLPGSSPGGGAVPATAARRLRGEVSNSSTDVIYIV